MEVEESVDETIELSCSARGFPTPSLVWTASDGRVRHGERALSRSSCLLGLLTRLCVFDQQNLETDPLEMEPQEAEPQEREPMETDGVIRSSLRFSVTSDVTVFCNISNEYGANAVTFNVKTREFPVAPACSVCVHLYVPPPVTL